MADIQIDKTSATGSPKVFTFADGSSLHIWDGGGRLLNAAGKPVGDQLDFDFGPAVDTSLSKGFAAAMLSDGRIVLAVSDFDSYDPNTHLSAGRIAYRIFDKQGVPETGVKYVGDAAYNNGLPSITTDSKGGFTITYQAQNGRDPEIFAQQVNAKGNLVEHAI